MSQKTAQQGRRTKFKKQERKMGPKDQEKLFFKEAERPAMGRLSTGGGSTRVTNKNQKNKPRTKRKSYTMGL